MEYRGFEISLLKSARPTGWVWTIKADGQDLRTGTVTSHVHAVVSAQKAINSLLRARARAVAREQLSQSPN
jgi:hypothetical protein